MDWKALLTSPRGRIGRRDFWRGFAVVMLASIVLSLIPMVGQVVVLVLLWPQACIFAKRLHDSGRSGWLVLLPVAVTGAAILLMGMVGGAGLFDVGVGFDTAMGPVIRIAMVPALFALGFLLWVGLSRGEEAANRYGTPPVGEAAG